MEKRNQNNPTIFLEAVLKLKRCLQKTTSFVEWVNILEGKVGIRYGKRERETIKEGSLKTGEG